MKASSSRAHVIITNNKREKLGPKVGDSIIWILTGKGKIEIMEA